MVERLGSLERKRAAAKARATARQAAKIESIKRKPKGTLTLSEKRTLALLERSPPGKVTIIKSGSGGQPAKISFISKAELERRKMTQLQAEKARQAVLAKEVARRNLIAKRTGRRPETAFQIAAREFGRLTSADILLAKRKGFIIKKDEKGNPIIKDGFIQFESKFFPITPPQSREAEIKRKFSTAVKQEVGRLKGDVGILFTRANSIVKRKGFIESTRQLDKRLAQVTKSQILSVGRGFVKSTIKFPVEANLRILKKIIRKEKLTKEDIAKVKQRFDITQRDIDVKNFNRVRNIALLGVALGALIGAGGPIVAGTIKVASAIATPVFVVGVIKDARQRGIVPASVEAILDLAVLGAAAKLSSKVANRVLKIKPTQAKKLRIKAEKLFKTPKQKQLVRKLFKKGLKEFTFRERTRPLGKKRLRRLERKEIIRQLKLDPKETKELIRLRNKAARKEKIGRATDQLIDEIISGRQRLTPKLRASIRKQIRKLIVGKRSVSPLKIPRSFFQRIPRGEPSALRKLRIKEAKRTKADIAKEKLIDEILTGKVKLTPKASARIRKIIRKRIAKSQQIPRSVIESITRGEPRAIKKLRIKELRKARAKKAKDQLVDEILSGKIKLTSKVRASVRKVVRKALLKKRAIKPEKIGPPGRRGRGVFGKGIREKQFANFFKLKPQQQKAVATGARIVRKKTGFFVEKGTKSSRIVGTTQKNANTVSKEGLVLIQKVKTKPVSRIKAIKKASGKIKSTTKLKTLSREVEANKRLAMQKKNLAKRFNFPLMFRFANLEEKLSGRVIKDLRVRLREVSKVKVKEKPVTKVKEEVKPITKAKQRQRVKQKAKVQTKSKAKAAQQLRVQVRQAIRQAARIAERVIRRARQRLNTNQRRILQRLIQRLIKLLLVEFKFTKKTKKQLEEELIKFIKRASVIYRPSLAAIILGITAFKVPKFITGLEFRPVIIKRPARVRRSKRKKLLRSKVKMRKK